ncbi:serine protease [Rathayibacter iranicus]|uniref:Trypsin n=1 Tax=Rathayibacter iranicus NCPPB 2253 = VKM Ac-1602 TaxID=1328868 RepID=A0ABX5LGJ5_9MICO|nr:serine protease [Rathayibacter iranicus]MWV29523.1 serine protease [Rathayibacter iranicus NCPPB 2253 = VKM Ac-1602]PWJ66605.1 hypothetical protein B0H03_10152 [Rathayibacter iranicus NCPPB 2253 = VKM Ac-1602]
MTVSRSPRRATAILAGICGITALATLCPALPSANAQSLRDQIPVVAGTALQLRGYGWCTAGAVLEPRTWLSRATPIGRATRYVVLAKHCAGIGSAVVVGGQVVGSVTWRSATYDLAIATIPPSQVQRPVCSGASQLHHCTLPDATPRAVGRIVLHSGPLPATVPVPGFGVPAVGEFFCTSGAMSFVLCGFSSVPIPPISWPPGTVAAGTYDGLMPIPGDSGGPVASYSGRLYGIIISAAINEYRGTLAYLPIPLVLQELGYIYGLAPA